MVIAQVHKRDWKIMSLICILWILPCIADSLFFEDSLGTRPAGMAGAFSGVADDANAVMHNPAGLSRINYITFSGMYADLFSQMNARVFNNQLDRLGYNFLALVIPYSEQVGTIGLSWNQFTSIFYQENSLLLSYGRTLLEKEHLDAGVNFKLLEWHMIENVYTTDYGKINWSADFGLLWQPVEKLKGAITFRNIVPTNIGLASDELLPVLITLGASYYLDFSVSQIDTLQIAFDQSYRNEEWDSKMGVEAWFMDKTMALRTGLSTIQFSTGFSYCYQPPNQLMQLQLDYAFTYPFYLQQSIGSHRIGLTVNWDKNLKERIVDNRKIIRDYYIEAIKKKYLGSQDEEKEVWQKIVLLNPGSYAIAEHLKNFVTLPYQSLNAVQKAFGLNIKQSDKIVKIKKVSALEPKRLSLPAKIQQFQLKISEDSNDLHEYIKERKKIAGEYLKKENVSLALSEMESIIDLDPENKIVKEQVKLLKERIRNKIGYYYAAGMEMIRQMHYLKAMQQFEMILKINPDYQPASSKLLMVKTVITEQFQDKFNKAEVLSKQGNFKEAVILLEEINEHWPTYPDLKEKLKENKEALILVISIPNRFKTAIHLLDLAQPEQAINQLLPLIKVRPEDPELLRLIDQLCIQEAYALKEYHSGLDAITSGDYFLGQQLILESLKKNNNIIARDYILKLTMQLGIKAFRKNDYEKAMYHWTIILSLVPDHHVVKMYLDKTKRQIKK